MNGIISEYSHNWIIWLIGLGLLIYIIRTIVVHNRKKQHKRLQIRLDYIINQFPNASRKNNLPTELNDKIESKIENILNRDFSIWEKEEQEIIRQQKQGQFVTKDKTKKSNPNHTDIKTIQNKETTADEEKKLQQAKEATHSKKIRKDKKETIEIEIEIEKELELLTQATQAGNIELAEEKIKTLGEITKSLTVDKELVKIIDKTKNDYIQKYAEGISDTFDVSHVDYMYPSEFIQGDYWNYPVAKFPSKHTVVFPFRRRQIARRGHMERKFQEYLEQELCHSKLLILGDCAILPAENYRPYEPDIAIVDIERPSIRIDIEIDEPYAAITKKPTHYIKCGDDFRDMNLNNSGWIVLRFTEYQVKSDMFGCASYIAKIVHSLNTSKPLPKSLLEHNIPQTQKRWTKIEAMIMASEKIREKYLNHEFGHVDDKPIEITDIKQTEKEKSCAKLIKPLTIAPHYSAEDTNYDERDKHIQFLQQEHIYLYNGQKQFVPVSDVISCFFQPFNSFRWSEYKANQRGVSQGQVLEEWDEKSARSREIGTFMHQQINNFYNRLPYQKEYSFKYKGKYVQKEEQIKLENEYLQFMEFLKNHHFTPFRIGWTIYDEKLKIAGTIDMIHKHGEVFEIYDWKRSNRITDIKGDPITINNFGEKGLGELFQIDDTPYWHYCIQQNLYRYILEKNYKIKVEKMYLVIFHNEINEYHKLDVPNMNETINSIIKACYDGTVTKQLISLRGANPS